MSSEANETLFPMGWCAVALPFHNYIPAPSPSPTFSSPSYIQFLTVSSNGAKLLLAFVSRPAPATWWGQGLSFDCLSMVRGIAQMFALCSCPFSWNV